MKFNRVYYETGCIFEKIKICKNHQISILFWKRVISSPKSINKLVSKCSRFLLLISLINHSLQTIVTNRHFTFSDFFSCWLVIKEMYIISSQHPTGLTNICIPTIFLLNYFGFRHDILPNLSVRHICYPKKYCL